MVWGVLPVMLPRVRLRRFEAAREHEHVPHAVPRGHREPPCSVDGDRDVWLTAWLTVAHVACVPGAG